MRYTPFAVLHILTVFSVYAATDEQAALMRQYHLSVPPTILGHTETPEPVRSDVDPESAALMREYHLSVPPIIQPRRQIAVEVPVIKPVYIDPPVRIEKPVASRVMAYTPKTTVSVIGEKCHCAA